MSSREQRRFLERPSKKINYQGDDSKNQQQTSTEPVPEPVKFEREPEPEQKKGRTKADKKLRTTGLVLIALFVVSAILAPTSSSVDTSEEAARALESRMSTQLPVGVRVMREDESLAGQDVTIVHSSPSDESQIHIWDYAAEDGDYVQVLVDGTAIGDPFMIKNKTTVFTVPTTGEVQVLGTRDGGGGITYAVHYDVNGTTYFNGTDVGNGNLYTLIRE